ncbi:MAG: 2-iminoacetate synthase ThiH [Fusobacteriia bacterium 4572_132]|nr:MAG: 2-iminoacetate synthase ThiH [Fusobacteriia bacterium 4572_132]
MFYDELKKYEKIDIEEYFKKVTDEDIKKSIKKEKLRQNDFLNLLSPKSKKYIKKMAIKAEKLTKQYFGKTIQLYLPMYLSNYCENRCLYCGFNTDNTIIRRKLNFDEIEEEAKEIQKLGIRHILILTGEAPNIAGLDYLKGAVKVLKKYFNSISIEVYPMDEEDYRELKEIGVDGLTIYQETYDKDIYKKVHISGKKMNYKYRMDAIESGAKAGFRSINIGALFGLGDLQKEAFLSGLHAKYLMDNYLDTEISISIPRINSAEGGFMANEELNNIQYIQYMLAFRLFMPKVGINISTRETANFRDKLLYLGATKFSVGSKTEVGGYTNGQKSTPQFEISDIRSTEETIESIRVKGFQPIYKDWEIL